MEDYNFELVLGTWNSMSAGFFDLRRVVRNVLLGIGFLTSALENYNFEVVLRTWNSMSAGFF